MAESHDERFENEILSITPANPGWQVHVQHVSLDPEMKREEVDEELVSPVAAWALVKWTDVDGSSVNRLEPVFLSSGRMINETEYKRMRAIYGLSDGGDVRIDIEVLAPNS